LRIYSYNNVPIPYISSTLRASSDISKMAIEFKNLKPEDYGFALPKANANGPGKSCWGNNSSPLSIEGPLMFEIKPGSDAPLTPFSSLNLQVSCQGEDENAALKLDTKILADSLKMVKDMFGPSRAKALTSVDLLRTIYKPFLKEGAIGKDGTPYSNYLVFKVAGWSQFVEDLNIIKKDKPNGETISYVKNCKWKDRFVGENDLGDRDTKFLLFLGTNETTGKPRFTEKIVALDENGSPIITGEGSDGKPLYKMRFVGPQDAKTGCKVKVIHKLSKLYVSESFGLIANANTVLIYEAEKKSHGSQGALEAKDLGIEVESEVNENSIAMASAMFSSRGADTDEALAGAASEESGGASSASKKRSASPPPSPMGPGNSSSPRAASIKKKKTKTQQVEEDF